MCARKAESSPIQILGLNQITVDHSLQSRVSTSVEYQREFSEAMMRGDEFPPVVVFFDGKKYWLADGFHRHAARKALAKNDKKFDQIKVEIHEGTKQDAIVFSAGANQKFSIPRKPEDIKKAVAMLLDVPGWQDATITRIIKHVGTDFSTAKRYRHDYFESRGIESPVLVKDDQGKTHYISPEKPKARKVREYVVPDEAANTPAGTVSFLGAAGKGVPAEAGVFVSGDPVEAARLLAGHFTGERLLRLISALQSIAAEKAAKMAKPKPRMTANP